MLVYHEGTKIFETTEMLHEKQNKNPEIVGAFRKQTDVGSGSLWYCGRTPVPT